MSTRICAIWNGFCKTQATREDKDRSESPSGKGRIEDQKTGTLEQRKGALPKVQNPLKAYAPGGKNPIVGATHRAGMSTG